MHRHGRSLFNSSINQKRDGMRAIRAKASTNPPRSRSNPTTTQGRQASKKDCGPSVVSCWIVIHLPHACPTHPAATGRDGLKVNNGTVHTHTEKHPEMDMGKVVGHFQSVNGLLHNCCFFSVYGWKKREKEPLLDRFIAVTPTPTQGGSIGGH